MTPDRLTVFDLEQASADELLALALRTLANRPLLRSIYDEPFLRKQIARRHDLTRNGLLLHLLLPDDRGAQEVLDGITCDLQTLGAPGVQQFRAQMCDPDRTRQESWRTELSFAAWITRLGYHVDLAPRVGQTKHGEFRVGSTPETWWEIKTPLDVAAVRKNARVEEAIAKWFHRIPEPVTFDVLAYDLTPERVPATSRQMRAQLAPIVAHGGTMPKTVAANGLIMHPRPSGRSAGGLGIRASKEYHFEHEHAKVAAAHIRAAAREQIPPKTAGVVVIDRSVATLMDDDDVEAACFGHLGVVHDAHGEFLSRCGGIFRAGYNTRVAAVISYSRAYVRHFPLSGRDVTIFHNPHACVPIPYDVFAADNVRQTVFSRVGTRSVYHIVDGTDAGRGASRERAAGKRCG